jgi:hypothetical protein
MNIFKSRHRTRTATPAAHDDRFRAAHGKAADQLRDPLTSVLMSAMR